jgi:hypothetical protein
VAGTLLLVLLPAVPGTAAPGPAPPGRAASGLPPASAWTAAVRDARRWAARRPERIRFALRVGRRAWSFRGAERVHSNSLVKATVMAAYLRRRDVRGRPLRADERALLGPMIRRSANGPVGVLIRRMGGVEPLRRVARAVGHRGFRPVAGLWGTSLVSAGGQARLFARLASLLPPRHKDYAMGLLRSVVPSQRWGLARARPAGWGIAFKAGWNGRGRVNQAARYTCHGEVVVVVVLVEGRSHGTSIRRQEQAGRRLLAPLRRRGRDACAAVGRAADQPARARASHAVGDAPVRAVNARERPDALEYPSSWASPTSCSPSSSRCWTTAIR